MKGMFGVIATLLLVTTAVAVAPRAAQAQPTLAQRCQADALTPAQAEARLHWARRCALIVNVRNPLSWIDVGIPAPDGTLRDYAEYDYSLNPMGRNSYVGSSWAYEVNGTILSMLYNPAQTSQYIDSHGFYIWERPVSRKKVRPLYPIYGTSPDYNAGAPLFPHPLHQNNCLFYSDKAGNPPTNPSPFYVIAYCESVP